jgi:DNA primase
MYLTKKNYFQAIRFIDSMEIESDVVSMIDSMLKVDPVFEPYDELMIKRLHSQAVNSPRAMRYYEGRRISEESVNKFSLGYSENQDMVIIPMMDPAGTMFVGFVARSVEGKDFKNTPKLPKSKILFNLHRAKKYDTVYVVESSFDAIRLDQNGVAAVATLGASVSNAQCDLLLKYFNNIIVVGDNDDAGKNMQQKILDKVGKRATLISIPSRFKDIGDMTDNDIHELTTRIDDPLLAMY